MPDYHPDLLKFLSADGAGKGLCPFCKKVLIIKLSDIRHKNLCSYHLSIPGDENQIVFTLIDDPYDVYIDFEERVLHIFYNNLNKESPTFIYDNFIIDYDTSNIDINSLMKEIPLFIRMR